MIAAVLAPRFFDTSTWSIRWPTPLNVLGVAGTIRMAATSSLPAVREAFRSASESFRLPPM